MPVLLVLLGWFFPRLVLFFVWFFAPGPLEHIFGGSPWWLLAGFFFVPLTTLVCAFFFDPLTGSVVGAGWIAVMVAVLVDFGVIGGSARYRL